MNPITKFKVGDKVDALGYNKTWHNITIIESVPGFNSLGWRCKNAAGLTGVFYAYELTPAAPFTVTVDADRKVVVNAPAPLSVDEARQCAGALAKAAAEAEDTRVLRSAVERGQFFSYDRSNTTAYMAIDAQTPGPAGTLAAVNHGGFTVWSEPSSKVYIRDGFHPSPLN